MSDVDDLNPTQTEGYHPGAKKNIDEYQKLDANDDSLRKWKESLGVKQGFAPKDDPRKVVVLGLIMEVEGRDDVFMDLSTPKVREQLKNSSIVIKEGINYNLKIRFRVQHEIVSGLKFLQSVKRMGVVVDRTEEMLGSYGPNNESRPYYEKQFPTELAPSGFTARGKYSVKSKFIDDDSTPHLIWAWNMEIRKDWL